ncbi:hypothetical protein [Archaeoglobus veneficus]|uniref:Uncharacterized protein n=1 Tax=Archaeoglobus veneficus (strain DSM 11195 / SNP6) TaxID=693661 RepID=F2KQ79_ARCVS|nr:hypothetical protein [Archaeoglobus veneficus]AEA46512.1 hypothetical protein Arcve_0481 [Archaeoglobus veneficus SNP6]
MRALAAILVFVVMGTAMAAVYYFSLESDVKVSETNLSVSPGSFSVTVAKGASYVRTVTIENTGESADIYFEKVVEGPDPDAISVSFHDIYGNSISSSNKLNVPAGSDESPSQVKVNVHISVDEDAEEGEYTVYIQAKG